MFFNILTVASRDLLVSAMNFGIASLLARALDKETLGIWFALQTLFIIADTFFRYRSDVVMVLRYKSGNNPAALGSQFLIAAAASLVILFITLTCSQLIFEEIKGLVPLANLWAVRVVLISLSLSILATTYIYYLTAKKAFQMYNFIIITQTLVNFAVVGGMIFFGITTVMSPVLGQLAAWVVVVPLAIKTFLSFRRDASWEETTVLGKEGMHFQFNSVIATLQLQTPRLFALYFLAAEHLAEVGLLFVLVSLMLKYPAAINTVFFAESKSELNLRYLRPIMMKLGIITLLLYLFAFIFSPTIIELAFGPLYADLVRTFTSILVFVLFHSLAIILLGLRNIVGDYSSMNKCICVAAASQCLYLFFANPSFASVVDSYAVFSTVFFLLSCFFTRNTIYEILS